MVTTRVSVRAELLRWAVERAPTDLRRKFPRLDDWLAGKVRPTLRQLEEFARAAAVPFGYLLLSQPPEERLPIPHFRTLAGVSAKWPSRDLLETVRIMERRQAWLREYLIDQGQAPLPYVGSATIRDDPIEVARSMRTALGLDADWADSCRSWTEALSTLREHAEEAGIVVATSSVVGNKTHRKLSVEEFRGFVLIDEYAPLVFVNAADAKAAQMFTLAHELAHVWLGQSAAFDLRELQPAADKTEQACNRIAAEFLVPSAALQAFWNEVRHQPDRFEQVARHFKVSELVAARRALDLRLIGRDEFRRFYSDYQQRARTAKPGDRRADFYVTQVLRLGRRFSQAVVLAAQSGQLLYREAYRLTGLYGRTFDRYAERVIRGLL